MRDEEQRPEFHTAREGDVRGVEGRAETRILRMAVRKYTFPWVNQAIDTVLHNRVTNGVEQASLQLPIDSCDG